MVVNFRWYLLLHRVPNPKVTTKARLKMVDLNYLFRGLVTLFPNLFTIYLQSECTEKYQVELCSKYDRERDFDVMLG